MRKPRKQNLTQSAVKSGCLSEQQIKNSLFPSHKLNLKVWIRKNKVNGEFSERKSEIDAFLTEVKFNMNYDYCNFCFINKFTKNLFTLDIKHYGKLWWVFKEV